MRTVTLRQYLWGLFLPQQQCYFAPFTSSFHSVWKKQLSLLRCIWKCFIDKEGQGSITVVLLPFNKVHAGTGKGDKLWMGSIPHSQKPFRTGAVAAKLVCKSAISRRNICSKHVTAMNWKWKNKVFFPLFSANGPTERGGVGSRNSQSQLISRRENTLDLVAVGAALQLSWIPMQATSKGRVQRARFPKGFFSTDSAPPMKNQSFLLQFRSYTAMHSARSE